MGRGVKVHTKTRLVGCTIEGGYVIGKDSQAKNEVFEQLTMGDIGDEDGFGIYDDEDSESQSEGSEEEEDAEEDDANDYGDDDLFDRS